MMTIRIEAVAGGWAVLASFCDSVLVFRSGAAAESTAVALAQACTRNGKVAEVTVLDRRGGHVATRRYAPGRWRTAGGAHGFHPGAVDGPTGPGLRRRSPSLL